MAAGVRTRLNAMIRDELARLDRSPRALRSFGRLVGGVLLGLAVIGWWRARTWWPWLATPGLVLVLLGSFAPRFLRGVHFGWMALTFVLGTVSGTVLLTLLFFLVLTPLSWLARISGKDFLRKRPLAPDASGWIPRDRERRATRADYERQF